LREEGAFQKFQSRISTISQTASPKIVHTDIELFHPVLNCLDRRNLAIKQERSSIVSSVECSPDDCIVFPYLALQFDLYEARFSLFEILLNKLSKTSLAAQRLGSRQIRSHN
jgi:hypothetical protein